MPLYMTYRSRLGTRAVWTVTAVWVSVICLVLWGWVLNLLALLDMGGDITGLMVARGIGVAIPPLGALLGFFA